MTTDRSHGPALRILAVSDFWDGSDGYAYVKAFRRAGHSVRAIPVDGFIPAEWRSAALRLLRRLLDPLLVREYNVGLRDAAAEFKPHLLFVFKGRNVMRETIEAIRACGATAVNVYPDVSFVVHGPYLPQALPVYDWIFQTKRFGILDMERQLGIRRASFFPHAFDPDVHRPVPLDAEDHARYDCDVSFIGTWSPKKADILRVVCRALPDVKIRIWGAQWREAAPDLARWTQGRGVHGTEFAKALLASRINVAILSEAKRGASSGDQTTSRTFHIPATGAFMLHERTPEFLEYFDEDHECGCFGSADELVERIRCYLPRDDVRQRLAAAGRRRVIESGHSVDCRVASVIEQVRLLRHDAAARSMPIEVGG